MKTISMVDLLTESDRIVRDLKSGERMRLTHGGEPLAELIPAPQASGKLSPLEALKHAHALNVSIPGVEETARRYLTELRPRATKNPLK